MPCLGASLLVHCCSHRFLCSWCPSAKLGTVQRSFRKKISLLRAEEWQRCSAQNKPLKVWEAWRDGCWPENNWPPLSEVVSILSRLVGAQIAWFQLLCVSVGRAGKWRKPFSPASPCSCFCFSEAMQDWTFTGSVWMEGCKKALEMLECQLGQ